MINVFSLWSFDAPSLRHQQALPITCPACSECMGEDELREHIKICGKRIHICHACGDNFLVEDNHDFLPCFNAFENKYKRLQAIRDQVPD